MAKRKAGPKQKNSPAVGGLSGPPSGAGTAGGTMTPKTIPRRKLLRLCELIHEVCATWQAAGISAHQGNTLVTQRYAAEAERLAGEFDQHLGQCRATLAGLNPPGGTPEAAVLSDLRAVASCLQANGNLPFGGRLNQLWAAGRQLRAAVDAVPLRPLIEALEYPQPPPESSQPTADDKTLRRRRARSPRPRWKSDLGELWLGDTLSKRYRQRAERQRLVLDAFQEEGWPSRIDSPLPSGDRAVLSNTLRRLNSGDTQIVFESDGREGILWRKRM
jgi:hypothetical protein